ncbi:MAG: hypothetical protein M1839_002540 [Geoglossum umbratile]|nr:MAG: hypothetical protein M1839_002540 [Geoglossum umbratile]
MSLEVKRFGLTRLHGPEEKKKSSVDVIFVHGLFGHPYYTWTFKGANPKSTAARSDAGNSQDAWKSQDARKSHDAGKSYDAPSDAATKSDAVISKLATSSAHSLRSSMSKVLRRGKDGQKRQERPCVKRSQAANAPEESSIGSEGASSIPEESNEEQSRILEVEAQAGVVTLDARSSYKMLEVLWPRDLLPAVLPDANIYTWGYDVDINHLLTPAGQLSIFQHANGLLSDICDERLTRIDRARPIIFVAHSLGGIVVKDALFMSKSSKTHLRNVFPATTGVCFLGTPHRGSGTATLGKTAYEISKIFFQRPALGILRCLEVNSTELDRISHNFSILLADRKPNVHSFMEERPTKGIMVVQTFSYAIGDAFETTHSIPASHSNMTKFASEKDEGFRRVSKVLIRWVNEILDAPELVNNPIAEKSEHGISESQACLNSLNWSETRTRIDEVEKTYRDTYQWIFTDRVSFVDWLGRLDENIFWIQGKPGSGKSTLMKFALHDPRTSSLLERSGKLAWTQVGFFFHDRGSELQKCANGLLAEMLYQILENMRGLVPVILPLYKKVRVRRTLTSSISTSPWYPEDLCEGLRLIADQDQIPLNICLFIDALDEHLGDHRAMLQTLNDFVNVARKRGHNIKFCLASRPENVFKTAFKDVPGFAIHEHTATDIQTYAFGKLQPELAVRSDAGQLKDLANDVVTKAQGVFLWVKLVVMELVEGACEGETIFSLQELLFSIPTELEGLYTRALARLVSKKLTGAGKAKLEEHCTEAMALFQIALCWRPQYTLGALFHATSFSLYGHAYEALKLDVQRRPQSTIEMGRLLTARCGGLLEAVHSHSHQFNEGDYVRFIHQTAKEFVQKGSAQSAFGNILQDKTEANGHVLLLRYCCQVLRQELDIPVPEFLYHAHKAEKETRQSQGIEIDALVSNQARSLQILENLFQEQNLTKEHAYLRAEINNLDILLILLGVAAQIPIYLSSKLRAVKRTPEEDGQILAAAILNFATDGFGGGVDGQAELEVLTTLFAAGIDPDTPYRDLFAKDQYTTASHQMVKSETRFRYRKAVGQLLWAHIASKKDQASDNMWSSWR